jgi:antitoxin component of MazEF toxin-antitoxin module
MVIRQIIKQGNSTVITIPKVLLDIMEWTLGDYVGLIVDNDKIIMQKVRFPRDEKQADTH